MKRISIASALAAVAVLALASSCGGNKSQVTPAQAPASGDITGAAAAQAAAPSGDSTAQGAAQPVATQSTVAPDAAPAAQSPNAAASGSATSPAAASPSAAPAPGAASAKPAVQRKIGEVVFAEGSVTLQRAGAAPERADIGTVARAYDVLVTGPKSRAEVDIGSGSSGGATVKLAENTAFYFDTKELGAERRRTVLQLLSGALAIKVDRLASGSFSVATDQAVLGVRGTVFIVDTVPDGSLLVTCESGAVAVGVDGETSTAKPGGVVELTGSSGLKLLAVEASGLGAYRGEWRTDAYKAFASKALTYTSSYAAAIDSGKPGFDAALAKLMAQKPALDAWRAAKAAGKEPRFTDWIAEKKAVSAALFDCLKALFSIERPYYRLMELKAMHDAGTGVGTMKDGRSSAAYFKAFDSSTKGLSLGMAQVREALSLFSWASAGSPMGDFFGSKAESLGTGAILLDD